MDTKSSKIRELKEKGCKAVNFGKEAITGFMKRYDSRKIIKVSICVMALCTIAIAENKVETPFLLLAIFLTLSGDTTE